MDLEREVKSVGVTFELSYGEQEIRVRAIDEG